MSPGSGVLTPLESPPCSTLSHPPVGGRTGAPARGQARLLPGGEGPGGPEPGEECGGEPGLEFVPFGFLAGGVPGTLQRPQGRRLTLDLGEGVLERAEDRPHQMARVEPAPGLALE